MCMKVESLENNDHYILKRAVEYLSQKRFKLSKEFKLSDGWDMMKAEKKNEKSGINKNKIITN